MASGEPPFIRYTIRLEGPATHGRRVSAALLRDLLEFLTEGARGALRLRVEGRSSAPGSAPGWLAAAADFEFVGVESGSTVLVFEARPVAEAAGGALDQGEFFEPLDPADSPFTLLQESLADALSGRLDSEKFDNALLNRLVQLGRVFAHGIEQVQITNGRRDGPVVSATPTSLETLRRLRRDTPPDQVARVAGWLDQIRHSDRMFTLKPESGAVLRGVAEGVAPEQLAGLWGKKATIHGRAVFRPSGRILRLEVLAIEAAGDDFAFWSQEPLALTEAALPQLRQPQTSRTGLNAMLGHWPGDESDEAVARALAELS
jgi:hypothetical protein